MRHLKTFESFENLSLYYGESVIGEYDLIISEISDILLEISDLGLNVMVGYTPMTLAMREKEPIIFVDVQGDSLKCSYIEDDIKSVLDRIENFAEIKGLRCGFGSWERPVDSGKYVSVYQIYIGK
jgi:hypothetical protein